MLLVIEINEIYACLSKLCVIQKIEQVDRLGASYLFGSNMA